MGATTSGVFAVRVRERRARAIMPCSGRGGIVDVRWWLFLALAACGGGDEDTGGGDPVNDNGACGAVTEHDLHIIGRAMASGVPVEGADVRLEERVWHTPPVDFGFALTGADGIFEFDAVGVVSVEDCWGTALDYVLVGVRGDQTVEDDANSSLFSAINDGRTEVDITDFPLEF